jgi:hypothetical protein
MDNSFHPNKNAKAEMQVSAFLVVLTNLFKNHFLQDLRKISIRMMRNHFYLSLKRLINYGKNISYIRLRQSQPDCSKPTKRLC